MKPTPLPWVKVWTDNDGDWLALPLEDRAIFYELVKLGGRGWPRGVVRGQDAGIAPMIGAQASVFTASVDRLCSKPHKSIKRVVGGLKVVNWAKYQGPARSLSHEQRGDSPRVTVARREEKREEEKRPEWVVAALEELREIEGYPFDEERDAIVLTKYANEFSTVDPLARVRAWAAYKLDLPLKEGEKPRSQLRTSFQTAVKYGRDLKTPTALPSYGPKRGIG